MLKEKINDDLIAAMKSKDMLCADTLRSLKTRIKNEEVAKTAELSDEEILPLISSEVKKRKDSVEAYNQGGRPELAQKENLEISILQKYLPAQLSEEEIRKVIDEALAGQEFAPQDFGKAMAQVMPKLKNQAPGDMVSKLVREKLGKQ